MLDREADEQVIRLVREVSESLTGLNMNLHKLSGTLHVATIETGRETGRHNKISRGLTWALVFFAAVQALVVLLPIFAKSDSKNAFDIHIQQKVFDECFDFYAKTLPEGMDETTAQTCKEKAEDFAERLELSQ